MKVGRKAGFQRLARAVKPGFDGSDGNIKHLGDVLIRDVMKIPEQDDSRVFRVKAVERLLNPLLDFFVFDILGRIDGAVGDDFRCRPGGYGAVASFAGSCGGCWRG